MRLPLSIALLGSLILAGAAVPARAQEQQIPGIPAQGQPAQQPATPAAAPEGQPAENPAKAPAKKPKVINNEDIEGKGGLLYPQAGRAGIDLSGINDCDRNCFERIRSEAGIAGGPGVQWKRDLLQNIDKVRTDARWQATLLELARVKGKFCDIEAEKNEELARRGDPRNVTETELAIEEEYQRKFQAAEQELINAFADLDAAMRNYHGVVLPFLAIQRQRIVNATCIQRQMPVYRQPVDDSDDP